jgi:hypothetical protein
MAELNTIKSALRAAPGLAGLSDVDAAAALNSPIYTPRQGRVTAATLAGATGWGATRAAQIKAALRALAASATPAGAAADLTLGVLDGAGFDPGDPESAKVAQLLVGAKICSADEAAVALNTIRYAAGAPDVSGEQVKTARAENARELALSQVRDDALAAAAAFANELVTAAELDPAKPVPTLVDFAAFVQQRSGQ